MKTAVVRSLLLLAVASAFGALTPTAFGVLCSATPNTANCDGKDPIAAGCSGDAVNLLPPVTSGATTVYLRYSPKCRSAWSRVDYGGVLIPSLKACVYRKVLTTNSPQCYTTASNNVFSNMLYLGKNTYQGRATGAANSATPTTTAWAFGY